MSSIDIGPCNPAVYLPVMAMLSTGTSSIAEAMLYCRLLYFHLSLFELRPATALLPAKSRLCRHHQVVVRCVKIPLLHVLSMIPCGNPYVEQF